MGIKQKNYDVIILGQGIAGTTLAWHLLWADQNVLVIDREEAVTSSGIAAGLMTPITGKRLVKNWMFDLFWPAAIQFYQRVESTIKTQCCVQGSMLRVFQSSAEREMFRSKENEYGASVQGVDAHHLAMFNAPFGGFEMLQAGRLRVREYLQASRTEFTKHHGYLASNVDVPSDLELQHGLVLIDRLGVHARHIVFCEGHTGQLNPWFKKVPFNPAKGEILTLKISGLSEKRIVHCGVWLVPLGNELFRCGSTYEWEEINTLPTEQGKADICRRLRLFLKQPFEVLEHQAAVRPVLMDSKPLIGLHPEHSQLGFLNGLGSKGSLQAPLLAEQLARCIVHGTPIDPEFDLNHKIQMSQ